MRFPHKVGGLPKLLMLSMLCAVFAIATDVHAQEDSISAGDVQAALEKLKSDPNLAGERKTRALRWRDDDDKQRETPGWLRWMGDLFEWLATTSQALMWIVIGVLAALLTFFVLQLFKRYQRPPPEQRTAVPTHVRDLDIRPETLPEDIGAAARALWDQGEHRAALALLYRGLLSLLVHDYAVPIRHSSTEGDCLELAQRYLQEPGAGYVTQLIQAWQRAVYGGKDPSTDEVHALCSNFASALRAQQLIDTQVSA